MMEKQKSKRLKRVVWLLILLAAFYFSARAYWNGLLGAPNPTDTSTKLFVVKKGESTAEIVDDLSKNGFIKSTLAFNYYLKNSGMAGKLQAGDFKLSRSMDVENIVKELTGGVVDKWVTILEGWRVEEIAQKLNEELGIKDEEFIKAARGKEGYLFPDTYLFNKDVKVSDIVLTLENTFDQRYTEGLQTQIKSKGLSTKQGVILASIVEREARSDEARKMVASILLKRLNIEMGLNTDATIQYALGFQPAEKSWWKRSLTKADLKIDSPYNTYTHAGLPPTPICNPSLSSLKAVAAADPSTPYLYYYHDSKGISHYAETLDEHNQNVANYP